MNVLKVVEELRVYRAQLEEAITALEDLARRRGKQRGRPPKWLSESKQPVTRVFSDATKKKMAASQRKRWAAVKKAKKSS